MSDFCPTVFDGASLIDALDSLLGEWQIYNYSGRGPHREEITPLIESLANGEISVSASTKANPNGTWGAVVKTTLPKEFWRHATYYFERPQRALVEVPTPGRRVIYSDPRIVVA